MEEAYGTIILPLHSPQLNDSEGTNPLMHAL